MDFSFFAFKYLSVLFFGSFLTTHVKACNIKYLNILPGRHWVLDSRLDLGLINGLDKCWRVKTSIGYRIRMTVETMRIAPVCEDRNSLLVYNGPSTSSRLLKRYCNTDSTTIASTGRYLLLRYRRRSSSSLYGFVVKFTPYRTSSTITVGFVNVSRYAIYGGIAIFFFIVFVLVLGCGKRYHMRHGRMPWVTTQRTMLSNSNQMTTTTTTTTVIPPSGAGGGYYNQGHTIMTPGAPPSYTTATQYPAVNGQQPYPSQIPPTAPNQAVQGGMPPPPNYQSVISGNVQNADNNIYQSINDEKSQAPAIDNQTYQVLQPPVQTPQQPAAAPYPTNQAPYPTTGAPYPTNQTPNPTTTAPYPTNQAPNPTTGAPYPTNQTPNN